MESKLAGGNPSRNSSTKGKRADRITTLVFFISVLVFFTGYNFSDNPPNGWYLQTMPNLGGRNISDICFIDTLYGWAVTPYTQQNDTTLVIKTTNGGDNWSIVYKGSAWFPGMNKVKFINRNTGYSCGSSMFSGGTGITKTTDGGYNWFSLNQPVTPGDYNDMFVLDENNIWLVMNEPLTGGVFRTTNGGVNWTQQLSAGNENPGIIYMYNPRIGFICKTSTMTNIRKTTDGGNSWSTVMQNEGFTDMYFVDSLNGWKTMGEVDSLKKTTDGGLNWTKLQLPHEGGFFFFSRLLRFSFINKDTIWGAGATAYTTNGTRGLIYISTNGGVNWGYQLPDINQINIPRYYFSRFTNKYNGWAYSTTRGVHTVTGGDSTIFVGIKNENNEIPSDYNLSQNYPNPFNSVTNIKFQISKTSDIKITVFDISGREITTIINERLPAGTYRTSWDAGSSSSGIYFYSLTADGKTIGTRKAVLIK